MTEEQPRGVRREAQREEVRLFGAPRPERFIDTPIGEALEKSSRIHYTEEADRNRLLAIEKLALDVLQNPLAIRAFVLNPEEYLRRAGFPDVQLDLNSREVRVAMALGDPELQAAAARGDVEGFIDAVLAQGIALSRSSDETAAAFPVEIVAVVSAAVHAWAVVVSYIGAAVFAAAETAVAAHHVVRVAGIPEVLPRSRVIEDLTNSLVYLAEYVGGEEFARTVRTRNMERITQEYAALIEEHQRERGEQEQEGRRE